jgi:hypothetical protein
VIQLPDCKSGVAKQNWKWRAGAFELPVPPPVSCPCVAVRFAKCGPALPTNLRQGFGWQAISGSVAQSEEQPVVCGKAEGASPFGSANFKSHRDAYSQGLRHCDSTSRSPSNYRDPSARSVGATRSAWDRGIAGALQFAKRTAQDWATIW